MINLKNIFPGLFSSKPSTQTTISNISSPGNIVPYPSTNNNMNIRSGSAIHALQQQQFNSYQQHLNAHNRALGQMNYSNFHPLYQGAPTKHHVPVMHANGSIEWVFQINLSDELANFKLCFENSEAFRNEVKSIASSKVFNDDLKSLIEESSDE